MFDLIFVNIIFCYFVVISQKHLFLNCNNDTLQNYFLIQPEITWPSS